MGVRVGGRVGGRVNRKNENLVWPSIRHDSCKCINWPESLTVVAGEVVRWHVSAAVLLRIYRAVLERFSVLCRTRRVRRQNILHGRLHLYSATYLTADWRTEYGHRQSPRVYRSDRSRFLIFFFCFSPFFFSLSVSRHSLPRDNITFSLRHTPVRPDTIHAYLQQCIIYTRVRTARMCLLLLLLLSTTYVVIILRATRRLAPKTGIQGPSASLQCINIYARRDLPGTDKIIRDTKFGFRCLRSGRHKNRRRRRRRDKNEAPPAAGPRIYDRTIIRDADNRNFRR